MIGFFLACKAVYLHRNLSMNQQTDILSIAHKQSFMYNELTVLQDIDRIVPGSVHYSIQRYRREAQWNMEDTGMLVYHYEKNNPDAHYLELKFCVTGNVYCREKQAECDFCKLNASKTCIEKVNSIDVLSFSFKPSYLSHDKKVRAGLSQYYPGHSYASFLLPVFLKNAVPAWYRIYRAHHFLLQKKIYYYKH